MKCITLRRTKESKAENGERILSLPPRRDELRYLKFDEQEQAIYDQFFTESKAEFNELSDKNEVMKNYVGILQKILRLRQICDHFELVMNKGLGIIGDTQTPQGLNYEQLAAAIAAEGIDACKAAAVFALLREAGTAQCVECTYDLGLPDSNADCCDAQENTPSASQKRNRKPKASGSRTSTRQNSPAPPLPILTRCQHLFCAACFRQSCYPGWPHVSSETRRCCSVCQTTLSPSDCIEVNTDAPPPGAESSGSGGSKKKGARKEKKQKMTSFENLQMSTKIKALLGDLIMFSRGNPHSANYDPESVEIQMVDNKGNSLEDGIVKSVVLYVPIFTFFLSCDLTIWVSVYSSQWTSMLDK